jgi:hypothetical protein
LRATVAVVRLVQEGVEALEHPLGHRRRLPHPHGCAQHQDVGVEDAPAHVGPRVAVALVGRHPGTDVEVDHAHRLVGLDPLLPERVAQLAEQHIGA